MSGNLKKTDKDSNERPTTVGCDVAKSNKYEEVKLTVLTILGAAAKFVAISELKKSYKMIEGRDIPFEDAGFESTSDLLKSFPATEIEFKIFNNVLHCKAITKDCFKHVTNLIRKSKGYSPKYGGYCTRPPLKNDLHQNKYRTRSMAKLSEEIESLMMSYSSGLPLNDFPDAYNKRFGRRLYLESYYVKNIEDLLKGLPDAVALVKEKNNIIVMKQFDRHHTKPVPGKDNLPSSKPSHIKSPNKEGPNTTILCVSINLKNNIVKVLQNHPNGIMSLRFRKAFKKETGDDLPESWHVHKELIEGMQELSDVVYVAHKSFFSWFFPVDTFVDVANLDSKEAENYYMQTVRDFFYNLLFTNPLGMPKDEIFTLYQNIYGEEISILMLGLPSYDFLICKMMDFLTTDYLGAGKASVKLKLIVDPVSNVPLDPQFILKDSAIEGEYVHYKLKLPVSYQVMVCEVERSGIFVFQLFNQVMEIDECMDNLDSFYNSKIGNSYLVPESYLKAGLMCAAKFSNIWHRCLVESVVFDDIHILYVDYGTRCCIEKHELRFLKKDFAQMTVQGLRGRMCGIKPLGDDGLLSPDAFDFFMNNVAEKLINSFLLTHDDDGVILINLHYQTSQNGRSKEKMKCGVTFNDVMVEMKFALPVDEPALQKNKNGKALKPDKVIIKEEKTFPSLIVKTPESTVPSGNITKIITLTEKYSMTLINLNRKPYIASCDLSLFLWDYDVACTMILDEEHRLHVFEKDHSELYLKLTNEIPGLRNEKEQNGVHLTLFELDFVSELLEKLNHSCENLKLAVQNVLDLFNPHDTFWTDEKELELLNDELDSFSQCNRIENKRTRSKARAEKFSQYQSQTNKDKSDSMFNNSSGKSLSGSLKTVSERPNAKLINRTSVKEMGGQGRGVMGFIENSDSISQGKNWKKNKKRSDKKKNQSHTNNVSSSQSEQSPKSKTSQVSEQDERRQPITQLVTDENNNADDVQAVKATKDRSPCKEECSDELEVAQTSTSLPSPLLMVDDFNVLTKCWSSWKAHFEAPIKLSSATPTTEAVTTGAAATTMGVLMPETSPAVTKALIDVCHSQLPETLISNDLLPFAKDNSFTVASSIRNSQVRLSDLYKNVESKLTQNIWSGGGVQFNQPVYYMTNYSKQGTLWNIVQLTNNFAPVRQVSPIPANVLPMSCVILPSYIGTRANSPPPLSGMTMQTFFHCLTTNTCNLQNPM